VRKVAERLGLTLPRQDQDQDQDQDTQCGGDGVAQKGHATKSRVQNVTEMLQLAYFHIPLNEYEGLVRVLREESAVESPQFGRFTNEKLCWGGWVWVVFWKIAFKFLPARGCVPSTLYTRTNYLSPPNACLDAATSARAFRPVRCSSSGNVYEYTQECAHARLCVDVSTGCSARLLIVSQHASKQDNSATRSKPA
jgi:hypothetical protein